MNYTKPAVAELGQAVCVIEGVIGKSTGSFDNLPQLTKQTPAYDLDE